MSVSILVSFVQNRVNNFFRDVFPDLLEKFDELIFRDVTVLVMIHLIESFYQLSLLLLRELKFAEELAALNFVKVMRPRHFVVLFSFLSDGRLVPLEFLGGAFFNFYLH